MTIMRRLAAAALLVALAPVPVFAMELALGVAQSVQPAVRTADGVNQKFSSVGGFKEHIGARRWTPYAV
jgi:hypothetical protein